MTHSNWICGLFFIVFGMAWQVDESPSSGKNLIYLIVLLLFAWGFVP